MPESGVIYFATGEQFVNEAVESCLSLKRKNESVHVTLFTDGESDNIEPFDDIVQVPPSDAPFYDRISAFRSSRYEKTLYLDTDTIVVGDINPLFDLLERFDVIAAHNETRDTAAPETKFETVSIDVPDSFPEYQCGVLGFTNSSTVDELFADWETRYEPYRYQNVLDQPFFRESLYHSEVQLGTLPPEYNLLVNYPGYIQEKAKILHFAGESPPYLGDLVTKGNESIARRRDPEKIAKRINQWSSEKRVFYYDGINRLQIISEARRRSLLLRALLSYSEVGFVKTLSRAVKLFRE